MEQKDDIVGQFPGLFLFSGPARMMRPVKNLAHERIELIGSFEQVYLHVALSSDEVVPGVRYLNFLLASSVLWSDFN